MSEIKVESSSLIDLSPLIKALPDPNEKKPSDKKTAVSIKTEKSDDGEGKLTIATALYSNITANEAKYVESTPVKRSLKDEIPPDTPGDVVDEIKDLMLEILSKQLLVVWEVTYKHNINALSASAYEALLLDPALPRAYGNPNFAIADRKVLLQSIRDGLTSICGRNGFQKMNSLSTMSASKESIGVVLNITEISDGRDFDIRDVVDPVRLGIRATVDDIVLHHPQRYNLDEKRGAFWYNFVFGVEDAGGALPLTARRTGNTSPFVLFSADRYELL